jgi:hypothetical protein
LSGTAAAAPPVIPGGRGGQGPGAHASRVNPDIPSDYHETGRWLEGFVRSHAKRESPRIEVRIETAGPREGHSYGVRLVMDERVYPPPSSPPLELPFREVVDGRSRFAWCAALGERARAAARELLRTAGAAR